VDFDNYEKEYLARLAGVSLEEQQALNKELAEEYDNDNNVVRINRVFSDSFGKHVDLKTGLEAIVEHTPSKRKIYVRYFFSNNDDTKIFSKDFEEISSKKNIIHLVIEPMHNPKNTNWNYEGQFKIGDNYESGYTLSITLKNDDPKFRKFLIGRLNLLGFGSIPSRTTIICHKDDNSPNERNAKELLENILHYITN